MAIWMENLWILGQKQKTEKIISDTFFQFSVLFRFFVKIWVFFAFALNLDRIFFILHMVCIFGPKLSNFMLPFSLKIGTFIIFCQNQRIFYASALQLGFLPFMDMFCIFWNKIQLLLVLRFSITVRIFTVLVQNSDILHTNCHFFTIFHQTLLPLHYTCH